VITGNTEHMTPAEATAALSAAPPGATIVYARGDVSLDSDHSNGAELQALRSLFWTAYRNGQVALTQRKISEGRFEYLAKKRKQ
jgi:hypothetical protein